MKDSRFTGVCEMKRDQFKKGLRAMLKTWEAGGADALERVIDGKKEGCNMVLKFSWPAESDDVVCLTLEAAQEKFPDCFENAEWYCHPAEVHFPEWSRNDPGLLLDHLMEARNGDSFYAGWCKVELLHGAQEIDR